MIFHQWFSAFTSLFFPRYCTVCHQVLLEKEQHICLTCLLKLPRTQFHLYPGNVMEQLFWGKVNVFQATSFFYYRKGSVYKQLLYELKYKGGKELGRYLGSVMANEIQLSSSFFRSIDLLIPVPLHPEKMKIRGYNQSEWIAKGVSDVVNIPIDTEHLIRVQFTETQTAKSTWERQKNIENAFSVKNIEDLCGKHILLIDDVVTTGATLASCARVLSVAPGVRFSLLTLAQAEY